MASRGAGGGGGLARNIGDAYARLTGTWGKFLDWAGNKLRRTMADPIDPESAFYPPLPDWPESYDAAIEIADGLKELRDREESLAGGVRVNTDRASLLLQQQQTMPHRLFVERSKQLRTEARQGVHELQLLRQEVERQKERLQDPSWRELVQIARAREQAATRGRATLEQVRETTSKELGEFTRIISQLGATFFASRNPPGLSPAQAAEAQDILQRSRSGPESFQTFVREFRTESEILHNYFAPNPADTFQVNDARNDMVMDQLITSASRTGAINTIETDFEVPRSLASAASTRRDPGLRTRLTELISVLEASNARLKAAEDGGGSGVASAAANLEVPQRRIPSIADRPTVNIFYSQPAVIRVHEFDTVKPAKAGGKAKRVLKKQRRTYRDVQEDVRDAYRHLTWPDMPVRKAESDPLETPACSGPGQPNLAQQLTVSYMNPYNVYGNEPGVSVMLVHSAGSGKTFTAEEIASCFTRAGHKVVIASKPSIQQALPKSGVDDMSDWNVQQFADGETITEAVIDYVARQAIPHRPQWDLDKAKHKTRRYLSKTGNLLEFIEKLAATATNNSGKGGGKGGGAGGSAKATAQPATKPRNKAQKRDDDDENEPERDERENSGLEAGVDWGDVDEEEDAAQGRGGRGRGGGRRDSNAAEMEGEDFRGESTRNDDSDDQKDDAYFAGLLGGAQAGAAAEEALLSPAQVAARAQAQQRRDADAKEKTKFGVRQFVMQKILPGMGAVIWTGAAISYLQLRNLVQRLTHVPSSDDVAYFFGGEKPPAAACLAAKCQHESCATGPRAYATCASQVGKDPLALTLLIIDEAHKIVSFSDVKQSDLPNFLTLREAIWNSYAKSGSRSVRVLLLTATPIAQHVIDLINLCTLLVPKERCAGFTEYGDINTEAGRARCEKKFMEDHWDFQANRFKPDSVRRMEELFKGCVSYFNFSGDSSRFAVPYQYVPDGQGGLDTQSQVQQLDIQISLLQENLLGKCLLQYTTAATNGQGGAVANALPGVFTYDPSTKQLAVKPGVLMPKETLTFPNSIVPGAMPNKTVSSCMQAYANFGNIGTSLANTAADSLIRTETLGSGEGGGGGGGAVPVGGRAAGGTTKSRRKSKGATGPRLLKVEQVFELRGQDLANFVWNDTFVLNGVVHHGLRTFSPLLLELVRGVRASRERGQEELAQYYQHLAPHEAPPLDKQLQQYKQLVITDTTYGAQGSELIAHLLTVLDYERVTHYATSKTGKGFQSLTRASKPYTGMMVLTKSPTQAVSKTEQAAARAELETKNKRKQKGGKQTTKKKTEEEEGGADDDEPREEEEEIEAEEDLGESVSDAGEDDSDLPPLVEDAAVKSGKKQAKPTREERWRAAYNNTATNADGREIAIAVTNGFFKEGVDFFDTRTIHVFGLFLTQADLIQAIARIIRNCKRKGTPFFGDRGGWPVEIVIYSPVIGAASGKRIPIVELLNLFRGDVVVSEAASKEAWEVMKRCAYDALVLETINSKSDSLENAAALYAGQWQVVNETDLPLRLFNDLGEATELPAASTFVSASSKGRDGGAATTTTYFGRGRPLGLGEVDRTTGELRTPYLYLHADGTPAQPSALQLRVTKEGKDVLRVQR